MTPSDWDILAQAQIYIRPSDTDGLLQTLTPANYNIIQKGQISGQSSSVDFLCYNMLTPIFVTSPDFRPFESIIAFFSSLTITFVAACLYCPPSFCTTWFLVNYLVLSGFLSSIGSNFVWE